jgi:hypothetical protein
VTARRLTSRKVALTAAFLSLAAGGVAACDISADDEWETTDSDYSYDGGNGPSNYGSGSSGSGSSGYSSGNGSGSYDDEEVTTDEVFYCADEEGEIVDPALCDDDEGTSSFYIWYSPSYPRGLKPGTMLDGGDYFPAGDRESRRAFKLPATGKVANGTIKTNVVGRGSVDSGGSSLSSGG